MFMCVRFRHGRRDDVTLTSRRDRDENDVAKMVRFFGKIFFMTPIILPIYIYTEIPLINKDLSLSISLYLSVL